MHKLFEVSSSSVVYQMQSMPMFFKASLVKYSPQASRRENPDLRESIDEMTVSQAELFGEVISEEVADTVAEVETSYQQTSFVSPQKTFDMTSVVSEDLIGPDGNKISTAYYDMLIADEPVEYKSNATFSKDNDRPHWIYTCWFRSTDVPASEKKQYPVRGLKFYFSDNRFFYFTAKTTLSLSEGMKITLKRGKMLSISGDVVALDCEEGIGFRFKRSDVTKAEMRLKEWWKNGVYTVSRSSLAGLIATPDGSFSLTVDTDRNALMFTFGQFSGEFAVSPKVDWRNWNYIAADFTDGSVFGFAEELIERASDGKKFTENRLNETVSASVMKAGDFSYESIGIYSNGSPFNIRNIRLYENEYPLTEETALLDAMSMVARNSSKLIIVDDPNIKTSADFYSPAR